MGRLPIPKPSFLDRCVYLGYIYGERRWRDIDGQLYTWDARHGELEVFDSRGKHLGAAEPLNGTMIKPTRKGRKISV